MNLAGTGEGAPVLCCKWKLSHLQNNFLGDENSNPRRLQKHNIHSPDKSQRDLKYTHAEIDCKKLIQFSQQPMEKQSDHVIYSKKTQQHILFELSQCLSDIRLICKPDHDIQFLHLHVYRVIVLYKEYFQFMLQYIWSENKCE